jgi:hypothetical protein
MSKLIQRAEFLVGTMVEPVCAQRLGAGNLENY